MGGPIRRVGGLGGLVPEQEVTLTPGHSCELAQASSSRLHAVLHYHLRRPSRNMGKDSHIAHHPLLGPHYS